MFLDYFANGEIRLEKAKRESELKLILIGLLLLSCSDGYFELVRNKNFSIAFLCWSNGEDNFELLNSESYWNKEGRLKD